MSPPNNLVQTGAGAAPEPALAETPETHLAVVRETVAMESIAQLYDRAYPLIFAALARAGVTPASAPMGVVHGVPSEVFDLSVAVPVTSPFAGDGEVHGETLPAGRAAQLLVLGSYDEIGPSYERLYGWISEQGLTPTGVAWEQYLTEPEPGGDPADNVTLLSVQVAGSPIQQPTTS